MLAYRFREDGVYVETVELDDTDIIPKFHTLDAPPVKEGYYACMRDGWKLIAGNPPALTPSISDDQQWGEVRTDRNKRLADCDWTQLPDAPVDTAAWAAYRQELRDITAQPDPFNIVWPIAPGA